MRILLIEDEAPKRDKIRQFLESFLPRVDITMARSVRSAVDYVTDTPFDLLILDMSLPTFDVGNEEPGGRPQGFGGIEVLRHMAIDGTAIPTIVVTAYEAFAKSGRKVDLNSLAAELKKDHEESFVALVYYNSVLGTWKGELGNALLTLKSLWEEP